jgi:1-acyl-sn-glycerol-3-phosphate acyltransferase
MKMLTFLLMKPTIKGLENIPKKGPALVVVNHLGDADVVVVSGAIPYPLEPIGKIENRDDNWLVGPIFRAYGMIWIHRGKPDRRALRMALEGLKEGRIISIAPEGRQSLTGVLEPGTEGAGFLALKSGVPVIPVALTGTENSNTYGNLKKWRRAKVTLTVGKPFHVRESPERRNAIQDATRQIMEEIARLLPPERRGVYSYISSSSQD